MTARTHKEFSISFVYLATFWIYKNQVVDFNYYALLPIMLCIGAKGALFPDVDHAWQNVKEKTVFNRIINFLIHATGGKHRSWQTHSIDICLLSGALLLFTNHRFYIDGRLDRLNYQVFELILLAFYSGWISHLVSDALTVGGIRPTVFSKKTIRFVPKQIGNLKFNTGNQWEAYVYGFINKVNVVMSLIAFVYPLIINDDFITWVARLSG